MDLGDPVSLFVIGLTVITSLGILALGPGRTLNRLLALILILDVVAWQADAFVSMFLSDPASLFAAQGLSWVAGAAVTPLYILFVGTALDAPITRPLKRRSVQLALVGIAVVAALVYAAFFPTWKSYPEVALLNIANLPMGVAYLFGLVAAISAVVTTRRNPVERRRAIAFAVAFGVRDALQVPFLLSAPLLLATSWADIVIPVSELAILIFLTYGILQAQLLGIDLRIKWTLRRGTVAAVFLAAFFVVAQLVQNVANESLGYVAGGLVAGLMLFALRPIERAAARFADTAMSHVNDTPEYLAARRQDIYRAALEDSMSDGSITRKERTVLLRLAQNLGLDGNDAMRIEGEVLDARTTR